LRAAELAGLEIKDVTLTEVDGSISVTKTKTKVKGQWITGPTKSRKVRTVPLDAWLVHRIKTYLTDVHPYGNPKSFAYQPNAPLFPGRLDLARAKELQKNVKDRASLFDWASPIDCNNAYKRYLQPATEALGLPDVRWHDLRHTFAVMSLAGDHYRDVSRWLGHEKISTTLDFYASVIPSEHGGKKAPLPEPQAPVRETAADNVIELRPHGTE
jgi:integrase